MLLVDWILNNKQDLLDSLYDIKGKLDDLEVLLEENPDPYDGVSDEAYELLLSFDLVTLDESILRLKKVNNFFELDFAFASEFLSFAHNLQRVIELSVELQDKNSLNLFKDLEVNVNRCIDFLTFA